MDNPGDSKTLNTSQLESLQKELIELQTQLQKERAEKKQLKYTLGERNKELRCHNTLLTIFNQSGLSEEEFYTRIPDVVTHSCQFPDLSEACLIINDRTFKTKGYYPSKYELRTPVLLAEKTIGEIIVSYPKANFRDSEKIFVTEDRKRLKSIAEQIGNYIQRLAKESLVAERAIKYNKFIDASPDALVTCDLSGRIKYVSNKGWRMFGYKEEQLEGRSIFEFMAERDHSKAALAVEELIRVGYIGTREYLGLKADGSTFPIESIGELITNSNGDPFELMYSVRDISDRKKMEQNLLESERMLSNLMNNLPGVAYRCLKNASWSMLFMSRGCLELTGYSSDVFVGEKQKPYNEIIHPEDKQYVAKEVAAGLKRGNSFEVKYRIITAEGEIKHVWEKGQGVIDKGRLMYLEGMIMDVSSSHQLLGQLSESEQKYRSIFENIQDVYYETSIDGTILEISPSISVISRGQYTRKDLIGKSVYDFYADIKQREVLMERIKMQGSIKEFFTVLKNRDNSVVPIAVSATIHKDVNGTLQKIIGSFHDNTSQIEVRRVLQESKAINLKLKEAYEKLEANDRFKSTLINTISHEIRTPLNGILGFSEILAENKVSIDEKRLYLGKIYESSHRLIKTITDFIDISNLMAKSQAVVKKKVSPNLLVKQVVDEYFKISLQKEIPIIPDFPKEEEISLLSDSEILRKVLTNLLDNALKFTREGNIHIGFERIEDRLRFFIKDSGIGIAKHKLDEIFEAFVQEDSGSRRAFEGNGLGLSIAKSFVELLGGSIWIESEKGVGTKAFFEVPGVLETATLPEKPGNEKQGVDFRYTILVVEDDTLNYLYMSHLLDKPKVEIFHARDGFEAVNFARSHEDISLVLMDLRMPGMDGFSATTQIKKLLPKVPVIAITAYSGIENEQKAREAGCNDILLKPTKQEHLYKKLAEYSVIVD